MHTWDWFRKRRPGIWTTQGGSKLILTSSSKRHLNYIHHHDISPKAQSFHGPSTCFVVYCPGLSLALFHCNLRRKTRILIYFCHKNEPHLYVHTHTFDKGSPRSKVCRRAKRASFDVGSNCYYVPNQNGWYGLPVSASERLDEINIEAWNTIFPKCRRTWQLAGSNLG